MSTSATETREWNRAADKAKDTVGCASDMASHAANAVGAMASQAANDVGTIAGQAASDVGKMAGQAASDVGRKADELTANCGAGIQSFGETMRKNTPQSGYLGTASQAVANTVKDTGHYIEEHKLSGMTADVAQLVKRNPLSAVCIAVGLGWFIGRQLRG